MLNPIANNITELSSVSIVSAGLYPPKSIPNLLAWFDAKDASTISATGANVNTWSDKSGNGYHATAASTKEPSTGTVTINGVNAIDFNGTDEFLLAPTELAAAVSGTNKPLSVFIVCKADVLSGTKELLNFTNTALAASLLLFDFTGSQNRVFFRNNANNAADAKSVSDTHPHVFAYRLHDGVIQQFQDGVLRGTNGYTATAITLNVASIGSRFVVSASNYFDGAIGEIIVYDRKLSDTEMASVNSYLNQKWGFSNV